MKLLSAGSACARSIVTCVALLSAAAGQSRSAATQGAPVRVQMHNVLYHFTNDIAVHIQTVDGELVPIGGNEFPVFDDKNSFILRLASAEIAITAKSLANVLNKHVF